MVLTNCVAGTDGCRVRVAEGQQQRRVNSQGWGDEEERTRRGKTRFPWRELWNEEEEERTRRRKGKGVIFGGWLIAVVTGDNKGIGLEVCWQLASKGAAAVAEINRVGLSGGVIFHLLDITDASSIVNNAAIRGIELVDFPSFGLMPAEEKTYDTAKAGRRTNYYGTKQVTETLLPPEILLRWKSVLEGAGEETPHGAVGARQLREPGYVNTDMTRNSGLLHRGKALARVAMVTGGNKGIGLEVCRQLASDGGVTVVLTARDETRGTEAVDKLRRMGLSDVVFHQLDVTDASSVARLADFLETRFGKLDILVNNAAIGAMEYAPVVDTNEEQFVGMDGQQRIEWMNKQGQETYDTANNGVQTNFYGTRHVIQALLPILLSSPDGRIVNVSSQFGLLRFVSNEDVKKELDDVHSLTEERLDELLDKFLKDFEAGTLEAHGWPTTFAAYKMAKVAMNAYTRILARRHPSLRVNCAHPGYVKTDMTMNSGFLTTEVGGRNIVTVALQPYCGPTGAFFDEGKEAPFV
ncbi:hypothetical protein ABZP36_004159 [Zizania latifolia]